jgi:opacity protein-like surface antigen
MKHLIAVLALALAIPVVSLTAQSAQQFSAQGSLLYVSPSGDAYEGLESGAGFEFQVRYTPSAFSIGAGYQRSSHDLDFTEVGYGIRTATIAGVFVEPRYVIDVGSSSYAPYIAARLAKLTQSAEIEELDLKASASGTQMNIGGGVLVRLTPRINMDLGVTYGSIHFDDFKIEQGGATFTDPGSDSDGRNLVLRIGATIGLR